MTPRKKLKEIGLDYHKIAEFFGYSSAAFANSTRREFIEEGVLKVVEHIQIGGQNKNGDNADQSATGTEPHKI
jgi:hypothetical protein